MILCILKGDMHKVIFFPRKKIVEKKVCVSILPKIVRPVTRNTLIFLILHGYCMMGMFLTCLSYDVASGSEITPCNKIDNPLVVYRFTGNVMTSITTLRT